MEILVPLVLGGGALAVMAIVSGLAHRKKRQQPIAHGAASILIHAINDDRCTGCDACVAVCPTNVLDLVRNKSRVLRFQDCIQCEACMWACPTEALVMFSEGSQPPPVLGPQIDGFYQTVIPGQYLIGEVAGKPLVKNAANLGRAVVEHMLYLGLQATPGRTDFVDVLIVGSGPGGLSAALSCQQRGLSYLVIEKENIISSTVSRYPKGKHFMAEPYDTPNYSLLPVVDATKEDLVAMWQKLIKLCDLNIRMHETVQTVQKQQDGSFVTATTGGHYGSQRVVLATGTRGKPRSLGVPGENFPKVLSLLEDPAEHAGKSVCVVGGGDSALEAALALGEAGAKVVVSYRGKSFLRAQAKNRQKIERGIAEGRLKVALQSEIVEFGQDTVTLQMADGVQKRYPNQAAFVLIGADPPIKWLATLGVHYVERPHMQPMPASDVLVKQFVQHAQECPASASEAANQVFGRPVSAVKAPMPKPVAAREKVSVGRRFVASATSLLGIGDARSRAASRPAPIAGMETGWGVNRDALDPEERTRILRMLRDEGGRFADEDSQVYQMDDLLSPQNKTQHRDEVFKRRDQPLASIPRKDPFAKAENAVVGQSQSQAIVGLTQADLESLELELLDEHELDDNECTEHFSPEQAQALLGGAVAKPRERATADVSEMTSSSLGSSYLSSGDSGDFDDDDGPTRLSCIEELLEPGQAAEEATRVTSIEDMGLDVREPFGEDKTLPGTQESTLDEADLLP